MWKVGISKRQFDLLRFGIVSSVSREFLKSVVRQSQRQISVWQRTLSAGSSLTKFQVDLSFNFPQQIAALLPSLNI